MEPDLEPSLTSLEQAASSLDVDVDVDGQALRAAYVRQVKAHPPDTDPEGFERIRDAYELLRDPQRRLRHQLLGADPVAPLVELLDDGHDRGRYVGPGPWIEVLSERSKG